MNSIQELIQFILRHDNVVVFGNLGRHPKIIFDALAADPQLNVAIVSQYYVCESTPDNRVRVVNPNEPLDSCELYVILEPTPYQLIMKPSKALRMVVFTSHFTYSSRPETVWTNVCYFHTEPLSICTQAKYTQELLNIQNHSQQTQNANQIVVNAGNKLIISGRPDIPMELSNTYVIIDLSRFETPFIMYLAFLDAFEYMLENKNEIKEWLICFNPTHGRKGFDQFAQHCLDKLFCKRIEHGNVTNVGTILSLLPFYKSGSIDRRFDIPILRFGDVEYISAMVSDACKASLMYNLDHWVGKIYRIKD